MSTTDIHQLHPMSKIRGWCARVEQAEGAICRPYVAEQWIIVSVTVVLRRREDPPAAPMRACH
jgi:hypothetical protein